MGGKGGGREGGEGENKQVKGEREKGAKVSSPTIIINNQKE